MKQIVAIAQPHRPEAIVNIRTDERGDAAL